MKYTISGRDERTLMKLIVHVDSDRVVGCHMCAWGGEGGSEKGDGGTDGAAGEGGGGG